MKKRLQASAKQARRAIKLAKARLQRIINQPRIGDDSTHIEEHVQQVSASQLVPPLPEVDRSKQIVG